MGKPADNPLWNEIATVEVRSSRRKLFVQVVLPWFFVAPTTVFVIARLFLPAPLPLATAGLLALAIAAIPFAFRQRTSLRIHKDGIDHEHLGRIAWKRIDGIGAFSIAGRRLIKGDMLSFHLVDRPDMASRPGRMSRFARKELEEWHRISVPLRFTDGDALQAYTAATRSAAGSSLLQSVAWR